MGIKSKRVAFTFDELSVKTLTPDELAQLKRPRVCPCCNRMMQAHEFQRHTEIGPKLRDIFDSR